jgi:hypothetical protein
MAIEKNVIFIYPLVAVLNELKKYLEQDESYIIYEIDNVAEFAQLIGIVDHAITFSSDMKKTSRYLQENKSYVLKEETLCIAVTAAAVPSHIIEKLNKFGLDEVARDSIPLKSLQYKVENFFKKFIAKEELQKKLAQRATADDVTHFRSTEQKEIIQKRHVERLSLDEEIKDENLKGKIKNTDQNDLGGMLKKKQGLNLDLPENSQGLKRRQLSLPDLNQTKKRYRFVPLENANKATKGFKLALIDKEGLRGLKLAEQVSNSPLQGLKLESSEREARKGLRPQEKLQQPGMKGLALDEIEREGLKGLKLDDLPSNAGLKGLALDELSREGIKGLHLDEIPRDGISPLVAENAMLDLQKSLYEELAGLLKKDWGEQTIDYRQFKKRFHKEGANLTLDQKKELNRKLVEKLLSHQTFNYIEAKTYATEYLVHLISLYLNFQKEDMAVLKFIHFTLMKEYFGVVSFYIEAQEQYHACYQGHRQVSIEDYNFVNWEAYENELLAKINNYTIPTWKDETFQNTINEFIYPYYHDGKKLGVAIAHFNSKINTHLDANRVEVFFATAKGLMQQLKEHL